MCGHQALRWRCDTNLHCNSDQSSPSTHQDASSCTDRNIDPPEFIIAIIQQENCNDREQGILQQEPIDSLTDCPIITFEFPDDNVLGRH